MTDAPEVESTEDHSPSRGRRHARRREAHTEPVRVVSSAPKQMPGTVPVRRVVLRNRRGQLLTPSVLNDDGRPSSLRLAPYARVEVLEDRITPYTRDLAAQGHLSIEPTR